MREIPAEVLDQLNRGVIESASLVECLAIDFCQLFESAAPEVPCPHHLLRGDTGYMERMRNAGRVLHSALGMRGMTRCARHPSDTVRGWSAFMVEANDRLTLSSRLKQIQPLADDPHFGVRECAWMALRRRLATELEEGLHLLEPWGRSDRENLRRFAVEITRPRGVWCEHLSVLKEEPERAASLLEPVRSDPVAYVQRSVGNWLNDASKTRPDWVVAVCDRWRRESTTSATEAILRRAERSLKE